MSVDVDSLLDDDEDTVEDWKEERKEEDLAYEVDLDNPMLTTKKQREGLTQEEIDMLEAILAQRLVGMDRAVMCAHDSYEATKRITKKIEEVAKNCKKLKKIKFTCRLLVKYPLGSFPMEMWVTAPLHLGCRANEVIECFTQKLRVTKHKSSRRKLDAAGLVLVDGGTGAVVSVARTLAESSIRPNHVLLLLPSVSRLRFLVAETKRYADRFQRIQAAGAVLTQNGYEVNGSQQNNGPYQLEEQHTTNSVMSSASNSSTQSESSLSWLRSKLGMQSDEHSNTSSQGPQPGNHCWVRTWQIGGWRQAEIVAMPETQNSAGRSKSRSPPKPPKGVPEMKSPDLALVRWLEPKPDEPLCAQIQRNQIFLIPFQPPAGEVVLDQGDDDDDDDEDVHQTQDDFDDDASVGTHNTVSSISSRSSLGSHIALPPRALHQEQLRVQIVWRLGAPTEALAAWLRVPSPYGSKVKPRTLLKKFIKKLITERDTLRFRVYARHLCLATLDGAPLDETLPVAASLSAIAHKRRRALREHNKGKDAGLHTNKNRDAFYDEWREPPQAFEETLVCLPRVDVEALGVSGDTARSRDDEDFENFKKSRQAKREGRRGWVIETDGTLTACVLPSGKLAPSRNRLASASSASFSVALANTIDTALSGSDDAISSALTQDDSTSHAALRVSGGDTVVVHTDRLAPGQASKLRQVKLSQIVFEDELEAGAGPYASRGPTEDDGLGPRAAIPGLPTGLTWYNDDAAKRDMHAIDDATGKLVLQQVLPEFRKNGRLIFGDRPTARKGSIVKVVFPYKSLGISIALAQDNSKKKARRLIVLDNISPTCPPRAQLVLSSGDELISIDGFRVSPTLKGYQTAVAKLRCGARPIHLSFKKCRDVVPKNRAGLPDDDDGGHDFDDALTGRIARRSALEVAIVDLTADECVDVDLDDEDFDDDEYITTLTPRALARRDQQVHFPTEAEEEEEEEDDDTVLMDEASIVDMDDESLDDTGRPRLDTLEEEETDDAPQDEDDFPDGGYEEEKMLAIEPSPALAAIDDDDDDDDDDDALAPAKDDEQGMALIAADYENQEDDQSEDQDDNRDDDQNDDNNADDNEDDGVNDDADLDVDGDIDDDADLDVDGVNDDADLDVDGDIDDDEYVDMDAMDDEDEDDDDDKARYLVPIVRSGELKAGETDDKLIIPIDKSRTLTDVETIAFESTPRPLKPLTAAVKPPSEFSVALLEPASPLARRLHRRDAPVESSEDVQCVVYDRYGRYRACVCQDGSIRNNRDELLGYVNADLNQAGSATEDFLGELETAATANIITARGPFDEVVANCDLGTMRICAEANSTIAEITRSGDILGNDGSRLGQFDPFTFSDFKLAVLYVLFLDPGILSKREIDEERLGPSPDPYVDEPLSPLTVDTTMR